MSVLGTSESLYLKNQFCLPSRTAIHSQIKALPLHLRKNCVQCRRHKSHGLNPWVRKIPWSRKSQPSTIFLPGKSHGQRSLVGYSPWGGKESDLVTEHTHTHTHTLLHLHAERPVARPALLFPNKESTNPSPHSESWTLSASPIFPAIPAMVPCTQ